MTKHQIREEIFKIIFGMDAHGGEEIDRVV